MPFAHHWHYMTPWSELACLLFSLVSQSMRRLGGRWWISVFPVSSMGQMLFRRAWANYLEVAILSRCPKEHCSSAHHWPARLLPGGCSSFLPYSSASGNSGLGSEGSYASANHSGLHNSFTATIYLSSIYHIFNYLSSIYNLSIFYLVIHATLIFRNLAECVRSYKNEKGTLFSLQFVI